MKKPHCFTLPFASRTGNFEHFSPFIGILRPKWESAFLGRRRFVKRTYIYFVMSTLPLKTADDCIAFGRAANPSKEPLTVEQLKAYPGCEHYNDGTAATIVQTIEQLARILFEYIPEPLGYSDPPPKSISIDDAAIVKPLHSVTRKAS
ncbi:hypothetical protein [Dinghuibacter silviterrae]|nr:hypothetical protein [Dinghuibacter silviterrae]